MGIVSMDPGRYGKMMDHIPLLVFSNKGLVILCNQTAQQLLGTGMQSGLPLDVHAAGYAILDETGHKYRRGWLPWIRALRTKRWVSGAVCQFVLPDASIRWFNVVAMPVPDPQNGDVGTAVCMLTDITNQKSREHHLLDELRHVKTLSTCFSQGICSADSCQVCGIFRSALRTAVKRLVPSGKFYVFENHHDAANNLCPRCVCHITAQSSRHEHCDESQTAWQIMPAEWKDMLSKGKPVIVESEIPEAGKAFMRHMGLASGVLMSMFHSRVWTGFIVTGDALAGRPWTEERLGLANTITDVLKSMIEHKNAQHQLLQAHKMEMLGTLSTGLAHDFRNVLAKIKASLQMVMIEHPKLPENLADTCHEINQEIDEAAELIKRLLLLGCPTRTQSRWIPVNERIKLMLRMLRRIIPRNIAIEMDFPPHEMVVRLDPSHIERVVINLVLNARDAMPRGGKLKVSTSLVSGNDIVAPPLHISRDRHYICVTVADTGDGISPEAIKHVFEPFFTTKRNERGTGLGLSIVQSIIHRNRGCVIIESEVSQGTTFRCYFPGKRKGMSAISGKRVTA